MPKKIRVVVSGYFNPLHIGHLAMIREAKKLGDELFVIVNSDEQVKLKGSKPFMNQQDRFEIIQSLKGVDGVIVCFDQDRSVCKTLELLNPDIFCNGGDRSSKEIPEAKTCEQMGIKMVDNVGGKKIRSSSEIIK